MKSEKLVNALCKQMGLDWIDYETAEMINSCGDISTIEGFFHQDDAIQFFDDNKDVIEKYFTGLLEIEDNLEDELSDDISIRLLLGSARSVKELFKTLDDDTEKVVDIKVHAVGVALNNLAIDIMSGEYADHGKTLEEKNHEDEVDYKYDDWS